MKNVIELQNDIYFEVDEEQLFEQGVIKLSTDLHEDDLKEALDNILYVKNINTNGDRIVDLYIRSLKHGHIAFFEVYECLHEIGSITIEDMETPLLELLDYDLVIEALRGTGAPGFKALFEILGYKIVRHYDTNSIINANFDEELLESYVYGYHYYTVSHYKNNQLIETVNNALIRNQEDLKSFVEHQFNITEDFALVHNPLTELGFKDIPKVRKKVKEYEFSPIK